MQRDEQCSVSRRMGSCPLQMTETKPVSTLWEQGPKSQVVLAGSCGLLGACVGSSSHPLAAQGPSGRTAAPSRQTVAPALGVGLAMSAAHAA